MSNQTISITDSIYKYLKKVFSKSQYIGRLNYL